MTTPAARKSLDAQPLRDSSAFLAPFGVDISPELLELALTHRSWAFEHESSHHNERLEFLGDAVLGVHVTQMLFTEYPELPEGELAKRRSSLVSAVALADAARHFGLGEYLRLGKGEELTGGREKSSILADTLEALIGAAFLSGGQEAADRIIHAIVEYLRADPARFTTAIDPKSSLQELAFKLGEPTPHYKIETDGPEHDRVFTATVQLGAMRGSGTASSKKAAEAAAARQLLEQLDA